MKKKSASAQLKFLFAVLIFISAATCAATTFVYSQTNQPFSINNSPLPAPTGFVNDYAGVLDAVTKQQIEQKIKNFKDTSNPPVELAVAVVKTTAERPIFDYSLAVSRGWKIGSKADDNPSALLFIAIDDRKYYTQVSKDLEDELPDGVTGSLQRQYLVPAFKQGDYGKGISETIDAYIRTIQAKQTGGAPPIVSQSEQTSGRSRSGSPCNIVVCLIILFVLMLIIFSRRGGGGGGNNRSRWGGGGGFGGGGSALPWIIGGILSSGSSGSSSSSDWGGSSGGGSDWGGFGGGGDFGGGGAGGDW